MTEEGKQRLMGQAGKAAGGALGHMAKGLFNSQGRRPRIVAHTGGTPPIARMGNMQGSGRDIKQGMNLELLKSPLLRGTDISGKRIRKG